MKEIDTFLTHCYDALLAYNHSSRDDEAEGYCPCASMLDVLPQSQK